MRHMGIMTHYRAYPQNYHKKQPENNVPAFILRHNSMLRSTRTFTKTLHIFKTRYVLNIHYMVLTYKNKNYIISIVIEKGLPATRKSKGQSTAQFMRCLYYITNADRRKGRKHMNEIIITTGAEIQPAAGIQILLERFIAYIDVQEVTVKSYGVCLRCFMEWLQDNNIRQPQRADILDYVKYLASPHPRRTRCDRSNSEPGSIITYSAGTQARYLRAVKMFFKWTSQEGLFPNVADNVKGAKVRADNTKRDPLMKDDAKTVLDSIDTSTDAGKRDYAMILLSITAGLRIIEMQRANIGNMETLAGEHVLFIQGKGHDEADAYKKLTPEVYSAIMDYLNTRTKKDDAAPLFASTGNRSRGQRLTEPSISRIIKTRLVNAGYDTHRISAHSLRHTSVTFLLEAGATIQEAQHHARHASPETTGIYAHNIDQRKDHSEQRIYNFLFGIETDAATQAADCMRRMNAAQQAQALQLLQAIAG